MVTGRVKTEQQARQHRADRVKMFEGRLTLVVAFRLLLPVSFGVGFIAVFLGGSAVAQQNLTR